MKRKFKAISVETEKWVHGLPFSMDFTEKVTHIQDGAHFYPIKPETLSEYTGRKDVNGTKIYENDILSFKGSKYNREDRSPVKFNNYYGAFVVEGRGHEDGINENLFYLTDADERFTVIGNVFENPELLKVDTKEDDERPDYLDDEHCCEYNADGMCEICGAVRPGSPLYLEIYGGE